MPPEPNTPPPTTSCNRCRMQGNLRGACPPPLEIYSLASSQVKLSASWLPTLGPLEEQNGVLVLW